MGAAGPFGLPFDRAPLPPPRLIRVQPRDARRGDLVVTATELEGYPPRPSTSSRTEHRNRQAGEQVNILRRYAGRASPMARKPCGPGRRGVTGAALAR